MIDEVFEKIDNSLVSLKSVEFYLSTLVTEDAKKILSATLCQDLKIVEGHISKAISRLDTYSKTKPSQG